MNNMEQITLNEKLLNFCGFTFIKHQLSKNKSEKVWSLGDTTFHYDIDLVYNSNN
jgi:hypothetical protein